MNQSELFPMARNTDPATSHAAAEKFAETNLSKRRGQVWLCLKAHPFSTAGELSRFFHRMYPDLSFMIAAKAPGQRLHELEKLGYARRGPVRPCLDSGHQAETWEALDAQAQSD